MLRNTNTGAFEVYDIASNQLVGATSLGQVGLNWQLGGFAADPASGATVSPAESSQCAQLMQAMAGFGGGGAADGPGGVAPAGETAQQSLLSLPQHT